MKCIHCKSIFVCWNWVHTVDDEWGHECYKCGNCFETKDKIKYGIPHWMLQLLDRIFDISTDY